MTWVRVSSNSVPRRAAWLQPVLGTLLNMLLGVLAGGAAVLVMTLGQKLKGRFFSRAAGTS